MGHQKWMPSFRKKDLKRYFEWHKGNKGLNDFFESPRFFVNNFIGFSFRIFGYGFTFKIRIYDPVRGIIESSEEQ